MESFEALGLSSSALQALAKKGIVEPSPIQEKVIPLLLSGHIDIIGQAQTGTGKTAAFSLPIIDKIESRSKGVQALVLTPTRELAIQVCEEMASLRGKKDLKFAPIYGGQSMQQQMRSLKDGVHVVVGTPGRILDHLRRKSLNLQSLSYCVLDEADEMLNMGFLEDIKTILDQTNQDKRNLLFSATMPKEILRVAKQYMGPYELVQTHTKAMTIATTEQVYFQVSDGEKFSALVSVLELESKFYGLVFCRTKNEVDNLAQKLSQNGYNADALHGDLSQSQREKVLGSFRNRKIKILVATDVAARGLDVTDLSHVINYTLPQNPESYVHRIGRTGRAGKGGKAISFVTPREGKQLHMISKVIRADIRREMLPSSQEIMAAKKRQLVSDLQTLMNGESHQAYRSLARELLSSYDAEPIVAALLQHSSVDALNPVTHREKRTAPKGSDGQTRLFVAMGKVDGLTPQKLAEFMCRAIPMPSQKLQEISVRDDFSFMTAPNREAELLIKFFRKQKKDLKNLVSRALPPK